LTGSVYSHLVVSESASKDGGHRKWRRKKYKTKIIKSRKGNAGKSY
jgi:hypothetical protein